MENTESERRKAKRFKYSTDARFLLRGESEAVGTVLDVSEGGLALLTDERAEEGDDIIVYPEGLGRLTGKVVRTFQGGVGVAFTHSVAQRETVRKKITQALKGTPYMRLCEQRADMRMKFNIDTQVSLEGSDNPIPCTIVDMSQSGCLLKCETKPPIGLSVKIGMLGGRVSRHDSQGFAVEFQGQGSAQTELREKSDEPVKRAKQA